MPKVYNMRNAPKDAIYIGRGSPYGNPYVIGKDGDRETVIRLFKENVLPSLDVSKLKGKNLKCFCSPRACHGDSILEKANDKPDSTIKEKENHS